MEIMTNKKEDYHDTFFEYQIEKVEDETICRQVKKHILEAEYKTYD